MRRPELTVPQILAWADAHHARTGKWPGHRAGAVAGAPGESWRYIEWALRSGLRGLPGGDSLARLLARERGAHNRKDRPRLTVRKILGWADAHRRRTGGWPMVLSGAIPEAPGECWRAVNMALYKGQRGLPGDDSLARLLLRERGAYNPVARPPLRVGQILGWAEAHRGRTGGWPSALSGPIPEAPGESWRAVDDALRRGYRGLPGGDSLARLLARQGRPQRRL